MEKGDREHIRGAQGLPDEALPMWGSLTDRMFSNPQGTIGKLPVVSDTWLIHLHSPHPLDAPSLETKRISWAALTGGKPMERSRSQNQSKYCRIGNNGQICPSPCSGFGFYYCQDT
jgi:hypothetical protein